MHIFREAGIKNSRSKGIVLTLLILIFLIPFSQVTTSQQLGEGAKLAGNTPFVFAEAKFWILAVDLGVGLSSTEATDSNYGNEPSPIDFSLARKLYPIKIMNLGPYMVYLSRFFSNGNYKQSRTFGGAEFDFPGEGLPISAFAGSNLTNNI